MTKKIEDLLEKILEEVSSMRHRIEVIERKIGKKRNNVSLASAAIAALHIIGPSPTKIAEYIGCTREHLYRMPEFMSQYDALKERAKRAKKGKATNSDQGDFEAWEDDSDD